MAKREQYICSNCGRKEVKWFGQCPSCKEYNTAEEIPEETLSPSNVAKIRVVSKKEAILLKDVERNKNDRLLTKIPEFDRVMGGGIVSDSITIMTAPPGAGKSTLCLQVCDKIVDLGKNVLYASGEESSSQIKGRAERLGIKNTDKLLILDDANMDVIAENIKNKKIDFFILDSINSVYLNEYLPSRAGNPSQILGCSELIRSICKQGSKPVSCIMIGQMTKEDELAGSRSLEHLVDTYLRLEGEREDSLRILQAVKNRFGNTDESGFFNMTEEGLESIENPSEYFMTEREEAVVGSALTVLREGSRPVIAEIESLVSSSFSPYPSRIGDSLRKDQLNTLISILEQRAGMNFYNKNVIIKTGGNLKLKDNSSSLAILMSIASSGYKMSLELKSAYLADVGLTGELKKIPNIEQRLRELDRRGYTKAYIAKGYNFKSSFKLDNLKLIECKTIREVINKEILSKKGYEKNADDSETKESYKEE